MTFGFGRRLTLVTTVLITVLLWALIAGVALFAFGSYIAMLRSEALATRDVLVADIGDGPAARNAELAAQVAASRVWRRELLLIAVDENHRADVYRAPGPGTKPIIDVRQRGNFSDPQATGPLARPTLALATLFGNQTARAHVGTVDLFVRPNDAVLAATVDAYVRPLLAALALALALAFVVARVVTRQALKPLVDVTMALERFAAGDLSPRPIEANMRHELGVLAEAYNGAIAQMEHAFGERDKANASIRQFIADAGHELRTPLTVIRGFIAILRKGELRDPADYARILQQMNRQSLVMGSLIDKLMLLDRWERDGLAIAQPIDVAQLVDDVVTPIAEAQPARAVRLELEHGPLVAIDPGDLTHAITNLVDNALKYTAGTVDVRVASDDGRVKIEVADQGPGMTQEEAGHAFDRFFRGGRRDVEGSGLGLAIARRAVERADGTIELESSPDGGSTFTISLPRRAAAVALERYATI